MMFVVYETENDHPPKMDVMARSSDGKYSKSTFDTPDSIPLRDA